MLVLTPLPVIVGGRRKERRGRQAGTRRLLSATLVVDSFDAEPSKEDFTNE